MRDRLARAGPHGRRHQGRACRARRPVGRGEEHRRPGDLAGDHRRLRDRRRLSDQGERGTRHGRQARGLHQARDRPRRVRRAVLRDRRRDLLGSGPAGLRRPQARGVITCRSVQRP